MGSHTETFMQGWVTDDLEMILDACADDFVYDDPYDGRMTKAEFADYYRALPDEGEAAYTEGAARETDGEETHWMWWAWKPEGAGGWTHEGGSLTKARSDGVYLSRQAYYKGEGFLAKR